MMSIFACQLLLMRAPATVELVRTKLGTFRRYLSAKSSTIKIRTSSWHKAQLASCHDEVRILIFDDFVEN
jgi:hypothetical protein